MKARKLLIIEMFIFKITLMFFAIIVFCNDSYSQLIQDFKINQDSTLSDWIVYAKVSTNKSGKSVVVWQNYMRLSITAQIFNENFNRIGNNFKVNISDTCMFPDVFVRKDGSFGVVWKCRRISGDKVYLRIFNSNGNPITSEITLNDSPYKIIDNPQISGDSLGRFIVVWQLLNYYPQDYSIYCQIVDSSGSKIGSNTKVNEGQTSNGYPRIKARNDGSFIVAWQDYRPPSTANSDIYFQMYDKNGNKMGVNQKVNDSTEPLDDDTNPFIACDSSGNITIAFRERVYSSGITKGFYQKYTSQGVKIGNNKSISGLYGQYYLTGFDCDETGNYVFQFKSGYVYNIRVDKFDNAIGSHFLISNEFPETERDGEDLKLYKKRIINVFADERDTINRPQLYLNVRSYLNPDSIVYIRNITISQPKDYKLYQNYPNPFNPVTKIRFDVAKSSPRNPSPGRVFDLQRETLVILKVYDVLGREIAVLLNEKLSPGSYEVTFDGSRFSSGLYFYQLTINDIQLAIKKMVLMK